MVQAQDGSIRTFQRDGLNLTGSLKASGFNWWAEVTIKMFQPAGTVYPVEFLTNRHFNFNFL